jgi:hypothetical protein
VRGNVHNSTVQLFDLDVKLSDVDLELLTGLRDGDFLLGHIFHLGQQLVNFGLELGLLFLRPIDKEKYYAVTILTTISENYNW